MEVNENSCDTCVLSICDIHERFNNNFINIHQFCVAHRLLLDKLDCPKCGKACKLDFVEFLFKCYRCKKDKKNKKIRRCAFKQSVLYKSFFAKSRLPICTILKFCYLFCFRSFTVEFVLTDLRIAKQTFTDWSSFCREVCVDYTFKKSVTKLGGVGKIVEIDEAKFGKRKYNKGRVIKGTWVFGGFERGTKRIFLEPVKQRDSATLVEVIERLIEKGTTIYSDSWKAYDCLDEYGYNHLKVNHSINFIDPHT